MDRLDCSLGLGTSRPEPMETFVCNRVTEINPIRPPYIGETVQGRIIPLNCFQEG